MKKTIKYIFLALAVLLSGACVKGLPDTPETKTDPAYPEEGRVAIGMSIVVPGKGLSATKAMADTPTISGLRVAGFGSSGFLKETVDLDPSDFTSATTNSIISTGPL